MNEPENQRRYASFSERLLAHNIDLVPLLILFYLTTILPSTDYDFYLIGFIYIVYHTAFELSPMRATPGKKCIKLYVTSLTERSFAFKTILRNCLKPVSLLIFFLGFFMIQMNQKKQALHDYIAGTIVLLKEE